MIQLHMRRPNLKNLSPIVLPDGYALREYSQGDESGMATVLSASFGDEWTNERVIGEFVTRPDVVETYLIVHHNEIVATASSVINEKYNGAGYIHYVGASPDHGGKKLGYWVSMATLHDFARRGCNAAELDTDDFRLPAVKTYLNLGFAPVFTDETHEERWKIVMANLESS